jgi:hypothetical protein
VDGETCIGKVFIMCNLQNIIQTIKSKTMRKTDIIYGHKIFIKRDKKNWRTNVYVGGYH